MVSGGWANSPHSETLIWVPSLNRRMSLRLQLPLYITVKGQSRALGTQSALSKHMEVDELISWLINQYNQGPSIKEQHTHKAVLLWRFYSLPIGWVMSRGPLIAQGGMKTELCPAVPSSARQCPGCELLEEAALFRPSPFALSSSWCSSLALLAAHWGLYKREPYIPQDSHQHPPTFPAPPLATALQQDDSDWAISSQAFQKPGIVKYGCDHSILRPRKVHHKFKASLSYVSSFCLKQTNK